MKIEGAAMKKTSLGLPCAILVAAAAFTNDCRSFAQDLPSCGNKSVAYSPFDEHFASNIAVQPGPVSVLNMGENSSLHKKLPVARERLGAAPISGMGAVTPSNSDRACGNIISARKSTKTGLHKNLP
jgi:hypothetical protein